MLFLGGGHAWGFLFNFFKVTEIALITIKPTSFPGSLSLLSPLVVGRKTLVGACHVTTCDTNFSTGVESTNDFCGAKQKRNKVDRLSSTHGKFTFEILQSYSKLHTGQTKYIYIYPAY